MGGWSGSEVGGREVRAGPPCLLQLRDTAWSPEPPPSTHSIHPLCRSDSFFSIDNARENLLPRGWRGIRTPGIPINTSVFKTDSFNRSDIHPFALRPIYRKRALAGRGWLIYVIRYACFRLSADSIACLYWLATLFSYWYVGVLATLRLFLYDNMHLGLCAPCGQWFSKRVKNERSS